MCPAQESRDVKSLLRKSKEGGREGGREARMRAATHVGGTQPGRGREMEEAPDGSVVRARSERGAVTRRVLRRGVQSTRVSKKSMSYFNFPC